jgi:hypothetical protein
LNVFNSLETLPEDAMDIVVTTYFVYLAVSIALTVWVGRTLHQNGRVFLVDVFRGRMDLADSVNHLLVVGFYLINFGFVCWTLEVGYTIRDTRGSIEALSAKVGLVLLVLGLMHFFNLLVFSRMRSGSRRVEARQPQPDLRQRGGDPASGPARS